MENEVDDVEEGWTHVCLFSSRLETEALRASRIRWVIFSVLSYVGYIVSLSIHGFSTNKRLNTGYISVLAILTVVDGLLVALFVKGNLREFKLRNMWFKIISKSLFNFIGVYGCFQLLKTIHKHNRAICWIYVAWSGCSLAMFRVVSPTFDFSIPNLLAQVAMNESLNEEHKGDFELTIAVAVVCFLIFLAQGLLDHKGNDVDNDVIGWDPLLVIFESRVQVATLRFRRLSWAFLSLISTVTFTLSYIYHVTDPNLKDTIPYYWVVAVMVAMCFLQWALVKFNYFPDIKFKNKRFETAAKVIFESGGVYIGFYILAYMPSHTHGVCWMFFSLALFSLAFFKIVSPSFDFSIPSLLAQVAMNESLNDRHKLWFRLIVGVACWALFFFQAFIDFGWEWLRAKYMGLFENAENAGNFIDGAHGEGGEGGAGADQGQAGEDVGVGRGRGEIGGGGNDGGEGLEMVVWVNPDVRGGVGRGRGVNL